MRPLFPFYGSKWRTAQRYGAPSSHVIEPFAGSAGYSTFFEPTRVTLVDADPIIVGVWDYLIHATVRDILSLPDLAVGESVDDLDGLAQEARWLIGFWLNRGSAQPKKTRTAWASSFDPPKLDWSARARARIAADVPKLAGWTIALGDYTDAPVDPSATYFVDPPYIDKGRHYRVNTVNHAEIGAWSQALPGRTVVCEQAGADWLPFTTIGAAKATRGTSSEVIWTSTIDTTEAAA